MRVYILPSATVSYFQVESIALQSTSSMMYASSSSMSCIPESAAELEKTNVAVLKIYSNSFQPSKCRGNENLPADVNNDNMTTNHEVPGWNSCIYLGGTAVLDFHYIRHCQEWLWAQVQQYIRFLQILH